MKYRSLIMIFALLSFLPTADAAPTGEQLVDRAIEALGGHEAFSNLGVLELNPKEQENLLDGTIKKREKTVFIDSTNLRNVRVELTPTVIVARDGDEGWAQIEGALDERIQAPKMALRTANETIVPILMPFTLELDGIEFSAVEESTFKGRPTWRTVVTFPGHFFTSPSMNAPWIMNFSQKSGKLVAAEVYPPEEFRKALSEGMRYTVLRYTEIEGVQIPAEILRDGIDQSGTETGHASVITLNPSIRGPFEPALFMHPDRLKALEEGYDNRLR